jgi:hypothetical protein
MSYTLIERKQLDSAASSIEFTEIPQFYSDIVILTSLRSAQDDIATEIFIAFNGSTSSFSARQLFGSGSTVGSSTPARQVGLLPALQSTSNTFNNGTIYIPNYSGATNKSYSVDSVTENNATTAYQNIVTGLWSSTSPISSFTLTNTGSNNFAAGSSISLYGINRQQAIGAPKALGGQISFANGYWVHSFTGSGTFYTQQTLDCEYLVVAGGGAGGFSVGGGGGAGGFRTGFVQRLNGSYPVSVGSGGTGLASSNGGNGGNSSFAGISSTGGGGGGNNAAVPANSGGSGGGSGEGNNQGSGNLGGYTPVEGFAGGAAVESAPAYGAGGGGGAGGTGNNGTSSGGGNGGVGAFSTITGSSVVYAGGGGGSGYNSQNAGIGGSNIGGNGSYFAGPIAATNGTANRGAGGGGGSFDGGGTAGSGGSGIVIIRYKA